MSKFYVTCSWEQVPHLSPEVIDDMMAMLPPHQRDARSKGIPALGSGAIYPVPDDLYIIEPIQIPKHWKKVYGMDVGWNNTAVVWAAIDPESNTCYIYDCYKAGQLEPAQHAQVIRSRGAWIPGVIDPASRGRTQNDGTQLIQLYREQGLKLIEADNSVESGIYEVWQAMLNSQLKVFSTCAALIAEYRMYRRDEKGRIVKDNDHLLDALRYLVKSGISIAAHDLESDKKSSSFLRERNSDWTW